LETTRSILVKTHIVTSTLFNTLLWQDIKLHGYACKKHCKLCKTTWLTFWNIKTLHKLHEFWNFTELKLQGYQVSKMLKCYNEYCKLQSKLQTWKLKRRSYQKIVRYRGIELLRYLNKEILGFKLVGVPNRYRYLNNYKGERYSAPHLRVAFPTTLFQFSKNQPLLLQYEMTSIGPRSSKLKRCVNHSNFSLIGKSSKGQFVINAS